MFSLTVVKLILINSDNRPLMTPKITQIVNKILIEKKFINNIPKMDPIAVPNTKLNENKLIPSLLRVGGVIYAAIVPVAVVATAVAKPFIKRTIIKNQTEPGIK